MPAFAYTVEIEAPVEHVFAFDSNPENWPRTMPSLRNLEIVERTDRGARMRATSEILGLSLDSTMELTVVEPNEHIAVTVAGFGTSGEVHNHFSETASGTRIVHRAEYDQGDSPLERLFTPLVTRYNDRQIRAHLQNTKNLIEAERASEARLIA